MLRYCPQCRTDKPEIDFLSKNGVTHYGYCRECTRAYRRAYAFMRHGVPPAKQCEICGAEPTKDRALEFDHNHETGEFRGWLCFRCNVMIGHAFDDVEILYNAIHYLEQRGGKCKDANVEEQSSTVHTVDTPDSPDKLN